MTQHDQPSSPEHGYFSRLWTKKLKIPFPSFGEKSILIAVMGMTGAGKTYFIKQITGLKEMEVGHRLESCKCIPIHLNTILTSIYRHKRNSGRHGTNWWLQSASHRHYRLQ